MKKLTKVILNELNEWDLSCSEESTLKLELAKALTNVVKNCNLQNVSGSASDFYTDLMKLINSYCDKGLKKPDLVHKMEYATESCKLS